MSRTLLFHVTDDAGSRVVASDRSVTKIGTATTSHVRLIDKAASRMHAVVESTSDASVLYDLGSLAGTLLDGRRVTRWELGGEATFQMGGATVRVEVR